MLQNMLASTALSPQCNEVPNPSGIAEPTTASRRAPATPSSIAEMLATLPVRVPRDEAARLVTRFFFRVSHRSLERWPVTWRHLNNRAHVEVAELFAVAQRMLDEAPPVRGGLSAAPQSTAA